MLLLGCEYSHKFVPVAYLYFFYCIGFYLANYREKIKTLESFVLPICAFIFPIIACWVGVDNLHMGITDLSLFKNEDVGFALLNNIYNYLWGLVGCFGFVFWCHLLVDNLNEYLVKYISLIGQLSLQIFMIAHYFERFAYNIDLITSEIFVRGICEFVLLPILVIVSFFIIDYIVKITDKVPVLPTIIWGRRYPK